MATHFTLKQLSQIRSPCQFYLAQMPELKAFLTSDLKPPTQQTDEALVVTTQAMAKKHEEEGAIQAQKEESGAQPHVLMETQEQDGDGRFPSAGPASGDQTNVSNLEQTETLMQAPIGEDDSTNGWWQTLDKEVFVQRSISRGNRSVSND